MLLDPTLAHPGTTRHHSSMPTAPGTSPSEISRLAVRWYGEADPKIRFLQRYRPYICPFDRLVSLVRPGSRVLDLGCGAGLFLNLLHSQGRLEYGLGIDGSRTAIEAGRQAADGVASIRFEIGRVPLHPLAAGAKFDVVSLIDLVHHLPVSERPEILRWAASFLAPGGVLLLKDIAATPRWMTWANRLHDLLVAHELVSFSEVAQLDRWAQRAGLEKVSYERVRMLWDPHEIHVDRLATP